ncbi:Zinc finger and BTB domain-containing protein 11 isoform 1 [Hibiscus syriacus]|uniref:Zinc finger and BTB domain-containing protein 11 isoform 1 n=1 Tax=Hibiscus syriacus TaxID=106335 RepID=A0A6A2ZRH3_HIBSY|nr:Zinc finger and BTB domain-containing protein 11 isoform 1 [Hibiscus syriacus]
MEVKLSHKRHFLLSKSPLSDHTKASFPPRTLQFKPWAAAEIQRFQGLVKKWRLQNETKDYSCAHAVKGGENLSSISKMYGVSVHSIAAANKNIMHIDLVFQGQLLNIPAPSLLDTELDRVKKNRLLHSIRALKAPSGKTLFTVLTSHRLSKAKSTGYFLVAVPLIAFCIGCVISTFLTRVSRGIRQQAVDKSLTLHHGAKGMRWKSALSDTVEGNVFDSKSGLDSIGPSEDEAYIQYEEAPDDYGRLEHDYQKFLSECGITDFGYWRDASPGP